jgi:hypothetical protein
MIVFGTRLIIQVLRSEFAFANIVGENIRSPVALGERVGVFAGLGLWIVFWIIF